MKTVFHKSLVTILVMSMLIVAVVLTPGEAQARWHDRSDELPGMDMDLTPYLIVGGVVVVGLVTYMIASHHSKDKTDTDKTSDNTTVNQANPSGKTESDSLSQAPKQSQLTPAPKQSVPLGVFFNVTDDNARFGDKKSGLNLSALTFKAGVTIGF